MNIVDAFKLFYKTITGADVVGDNIADVIRNGAPVFKEYLESLVEHDDIS